MNINLTQGFFLFLLIGLTSIALVLINNFINLDLYDLVNWYGSGITIFWLLSLLIFLNKGINNAIRYNYIGFLLVLGLFHLGISLGGFFNYGNDYYDKNLARWLYSDYTVFSYLAVFFFILGYIISSFFNFKKKITDPKYTLDEQSIRISFYIYICLVFFWILIVRFISGIDNYTLYAEGSTNSSLLSSIFIYGNSLIGILYVLISTHSSYSKKALFILGIWGVFALPIGLRGEVFFPLVIGISFLVKQNLIKFNLLKTIITTFLILTTLSAIFVYRHGEKVEGTEVNPFAALIEMGSSLRPVYEVTKWIKNNEVDFYYGETYWAPLERIITKIIPYTERLQGSEDMRLMNVLIMDKAGPYGFSIVAESFINFNLLGTFIIGLLSGLFLKFFDSGDGKNFLMLSLLFALFFHIRQSFVSAFSVFIFSIIFCVLIKLLVLMLHRVKF